MLYWLSVLSVALLSFLLAMPATAALPTRYFSLLRVALCLLSNLATGALLALFHSVARHGFLSVADLFSSPLHVSFSIALLAFLHCASLFLCIVPLPFSPLWFTLFLHSIFCLLSFCSLTCFSLSLLAILTSDACTLSLQYPVFFCSLIGQWYHSL